MSETLNSVPLSGGIGAEILDLDLAEPLDSDQRDALGKLFVEHGLLVLRRQALSQDQQVRVMSYFGPTVDPSTETGYITNRDGWDSVKQTAELIFHSDWAFLPEPDTAFSLHALQVVDDMSSTLFASGVRALESLPRDLRARLTGLETLHVYPVDVTRRNRLADVPKGHRNAQRPLVMTHPESGKEYLYLSYMMLDSIVGLSSEASEALIAELCQYMFSPDNIQTHYWRSGDLVIWDNLAFQHARGDISDVGPRVLQKAMCSTHEFDRRALPEYAELLKSVEYSTTSPTAR